MSNERIIERENDGYIFRYFQTDKGKLYSFYDCERRMDQAVNALYRWFRRTVKTRTSYPKGDGEMSKHDLQRLRWVASDIAQYLEIMQRELDRLEGVDRASERIKALREVAGRTPEEAAMFLAKADQLEGGLEPCG